MNSYLKVSLDLKAGLSLQTSVFPDEQVVVIGLHRGLVDIKHCI